MIKIILLGKDLTIDNYIRWFKKDPTIEEQVNFFYLNGDIADGSFVVIEYIFVLQIIIINSFQDNFTCIAFADANNKNHDRLSRLLKMETIFTLEYTKKTNHQDVYLKKLDSSQLEKFTGS